MIGNTAQHVGKPSLRVDAVEFRRADQCVHCSRSLAAPLVELRAEDLRLAWRSLGRITGRADVEDLLDVIFAEFCLGK